MAQLVDNKISRHTEATSLDDTDVLYLLRDPSSTKLDRKITGANLKASMPSGGGGGTWGSITGTLSDQTDLQTALNGKSNTGHTHAQSDITNLTTDLAAKVPTTRTINGYDLSANRTLTASDVGAAATSHTHVQSDVTGLVAALAGKSDTSHTHTQSQSHNSPDTDTATTALHHTLGTGANQAAAGNHNHSGVYDPAGTASGLIATHEAAADPHTGYQKESEKNSAGGYAGLDGSSKLTGSQQVYGTTANTACQGNDSRLSDARTPLTHSHAQSDITNLTTDLAAKAPTSRTLTASSPITGGGTLASDRSFGFDQTVALGNNARIAVSKNSGATVSTRRRINFIEGTNVTLTIADDSVNEEVDVTIAASGGGGGGASLAQIMALGSLRT